MEEIRQNQGWYLICFESNKSSGQEVIQNFVEVEVDIFTKISKLL